MISRPGETGPSARRWPTSTDAFREAWEKGLCWRPRGLAPSSVSGRPDGVGALSSLQALGIVIRGIGEILGFYLLGTWERLGRGPQSPVWR